MVFFDKQIPENERIPLSDVMELFRAERSGILNWALAGFQKYLADGKRIDKATAIKRATDEYKRDSDTLGDFIEEELIEGGFEYMSDVFREYSAFCDQRKERSAFHSNRSFKAAFIERGYVVEKGGSKRQDRIMGFVLSKNAPATMGDKLDKSPF